MLYVPAAQVVQKLAPRLLYLPAAHLVVQELRPVDCWNLPAAQLVQELRPVYCWDLPAAQLVQLLEPDPLYLPGAQVEQEVAALNPALYLPPVPARSELAITESNWARGTGRKLWGRGPSRQCDTSQRGLSQHACGRGYCV